MAAPVTIETERLLLRDWRERTPSRSPRSMPIRG